MIVYLSLIETADDKRKFEVIYSEYKDLMFCVANNILGDTNDSEDVVHQAFLRIIENMDKIDTAKCPKTRGYVVTIVERLAIDLYRSRKRRAAVSLDEENINVPCVSEIEKIDKKSAIAAAMASLPTKYRELLLLKYDSGFSEKEITQMLSMTQANVHKTIQRAKAKLSSVLEEMRGE